MAPACASRRGVCRRRCGILRLCADPAQCAFTVRGECRGAGRTRVGAAVFVLVRRGAPALSPAVVVALALLVRLPLVGTPPLLSDDLYRYLWEGTVLGAGGDPFATAPAAWPGLDDVLRAHVNHPDVPSVYPPLALVWFRALALAGTRRSRAARDRRARCRARRPVVCGGGTARRGVVRAASPPRPRECLRRARRGAGRPVHRARGVVVAPRTPDGRVRRRHRRRPREGLSARGVAYPLVADATPSGSGSRRRGRPWFSRAAGGPGPTRSGDVAGRLAHLRAHLVVQRLRLARGRALARPGDPPGARRRRHGRDGFRRGADPRSSPGVVGRRDRVRAALPHGPSLVPVVGAGSRSAPRSGGLGGGVDPPARELRRARDGRSRDRCLDRAALVVVGDLPPAIVLLAIFRQTSVRSDPSPIEP
jgi:hypothetical protein